MTSTELLQSKLEQLGESIAVVDVQTFVTKTALNETLAEKKYMTESSRVSANNVSIDLPVIASTSEVKSVSNGNITKTDTGFTFAYPGGHSGASGFKTKDLIVESGRIVVNVEFKTIPAKFAVVFVGTKDDGGLAYIDQFDITNAGETRYTIDIDALKTRYTHLDMTKKFYLSCETTTNCTAEVTKFEVAKNDTKLDTTKSLLENLDAMYTKLDSLTTSTQ